MGNACRRPWRGFPRRYAANYYTINTGNPGRPDRPRQGRPVDDITRRQAIGDQGERVFRLPSQGLRRRAGRQHRFHYLAAGHV